MEKGTFAGLNKKPKSQKGWQEWNRKYALAFLSDQLDRVVHSAAKKNHIMSLLTKWERIFRSECAKEKPEETIGNAHNLVEDQIDFITQYIGCAILDGTSKQNLDRIKHFLSIQSAQNIGDRMELRFIGGSPIEAYAFVDSLNDIDIADVFFITNFNSIVAYREDMKTWTKKAAKSFLDALKEDLLFDMPHTVIMASHDEASGITGFEIPIRIDDSDLNIQMFRCMPPSLLKRFK
jgi:hypothetical protein